MYISFGRSLRTLGRVRICAGYRCRGLMGWSLLLVVAMLRMSWYLMLGVLWMIYGIFYLFMILPIRGIARLCKRDKKK